ncbi:G patch domain-containing protein 4 [Allomyces javanicus]|nr:G patch domain-containing protein 4 [Allomyces javanicus]
MSTGAASTSVRFGEEQLKRFGWKEGQGLGKKEQGITTHVRVSRKSDNKGIGQGKTDFSFQWWDHLYNKSTAQIVIAAADDGSVAVSAKEKTAKAAAVDLGATYVLPDEDDPLAAMFVKATPAEAKQAKDEDDENKDYSMNLTDAELLAICEGRTAAKGARANTLGKVLRSDGELGKKLLAIGSVAAETEASATPPPQAKKRTRDEVEADDVPSADPSSLGGTGDAKKRKKEKKERKERKAKKAKKGQKEEEKKRSKKDKKGKVRDLADEAPRKKKQKKGSKA